MSKIIKCKVCYDAGKPSTEYNSHFVRDQPGGIVVCPTILNQNCSYCKKQGHTPSCCPKLGGKYKKPDNNYKKKQQQAQQQQPQVPEPRTQLKMQQQSRVQAQLRTRARELCASPPPCVVEGKNYFKSLSAIIENEEVEAKRVAELNDNFPVIAAKINRNDGGKIIRPPQVNHAVLKCWAEAAAKEPQSAQEATEELKKALISDVINKENKSQKIIQKQLEEHRRVEEERRVEEFFQKEKESYAQKQAQQAQAQQAQAQAQQAQAQQADEDSDEEEEVEIKAPTMISWSDVE